MIENSKITSTEVAITKNTSSSDAISNGIEKLGGISAFIDKGDKIFIKISLKAPYGFPVNVNFESLRDLIILCKNEGAKQILIGSFPEYGMKTQSIANILGFKPYLENIGAELILLENQDSYPLIDIEVNGKNIKFPEVILNSDKLVIFNQVNVDPIFKVTLSLLNSYSMVPIRFQKIEKVIGSRKDYIIHDQYEQDLISNILDIYCIKKPDLVINDLFYFLEGAGPFVYKDSNLKLTGLSVIGRDAIAADLITLKLFNIDFSSSDILLEARRRKLGITDISKISIIGEHIESLNIKAKLSVDNLNDIRMKNTIIKAGRICSGCFKGAYHLLNNINTHMTKDLKYIKKQYFLTGENPPEPESLENIIIFGDCAIESTKNREFRNVRKKSDRNYMDSIKKKIRKDYKSQKKSKIKEKRNKNIIEIPGCPPNLYQSLFTIHKYYGNSQTPDLVFYNNLIKSHYDEALKP